MALDIVALTVCVNYEDYLSLTLPLNRAFFASYKIITDFANAKKLETLAKENNSELIVTDSFYDDNAPFNKGKAINHALKKLRPEKRDGWVCHLDADIILPKNFENLINACPLNTRAIYGCARYYCPKKPKELEKCLERNTDPTKWRKGKSPGHYYIGNSKKWQPKIPKRWMIRVPIGFFQLFNLNMGFEYPEHVPHAGDSDIYFACQWEKHEHLDNIHAVHLPVLKGQSKDNWNGRKTPTLDNI
jgi:hypothetical protein